VVLMRYAYKFDPEFTVANHEFSLLHYLGQYDVMVLNDIYNETVNWCVETFPDRKRQTRFYYSAWKFWVVADDDAFQFRMRWC
jgi:hypothetical protein